MHTSLASLPPSSSATDVLRSGLRWSALLGSLVLAHAPVLAVQVAVTIRNTSPTNGLWAVNPLVFVHNGSFDAFTAGAPASAAVEAAAEDGNPGPLRSAFSTAQPNGLAALIEGPFAPGQAVTHVFDLDPANPSHRYLSYLAMIIPSNDGFWGNDSPTAFPIFTTQGAFVPRTITVLGANVWDAGTEVNDELPATTAFLAQAAPNTGTTENGVVAIHPGFRVAGGGGILDATSSPTGSPLVFTAANFKQPGYVVAEITLSLVNGAPVAPSRLVNVSARGRAASGVNSQIVGFSVSPGPDRRMLVRAVGPGLAGFGVTGALADPTLTVFDQAGRIVATNDNWVSADVAAATQSAGAFPISSGSLDAALVLALSPGAYTAVVGTKANAEGVVLVECYEVRN